MTLFQPGTPELIFGTEIMTGAEVGVSTDSRLRGVYVVGTTGSGKTSLLADLVLQDIRAGRGVGVLDPHGDLVDRVVAQLPQHRIEDVILLDPRDNEFPFGLNPYASEQSTDDIVVGRLTARIVEMFQKLWGQEGSQGTSWGPRVAQFIRNTALTCIEQQLTMVEIEPLLTNKEFRNQLVPRIRDAHLIAFWKAYEALGERVQLDRADSTLNKLDEFLSQPIVRNIVGQSHKTVNFRKFMDEGKIVLIPLGSGRLGATVADLLGSVMTLEFLNSALSREDVAESSRRLFCLYVDEYQRFATQTFAELLTEARKFGVATTLAHQTRAQLDAANRAATVNAANLVAFSVIGEDADDLVKQLDLTPPEPGVATRRQKLAISQDAVRHLTRNGHIDPMVRHLANRVLRNLVDFVDSGEEMHWWAPADDEEAWKDTYKNGLEYFTRSTTARKGLQLINSYLVDVMEHGAGNFKERYSEWLWAIVDTLRAFYGIARNDIPIVVQEPRREPEVTWATENLDDQSMNAMQSLLDQILDRGNLRVLGDELIEARTQYQGEPRLLAHVWAEASLRRYVPQVRRRAQFEAQNAKDTIFCLVSLGMLLSYEPILTETGQWETVLEHPRPYADVAAERANRLTRQPQFRATASLSLDGGREDFEIWTPSFVIQDEAHSFQSTERSDIRERSRVEYCRARMDVVTEIANRFNTNPSEHEFERQKVVRLDAPEKPPQSTTLMFCLYCGRSLSIEAGFCVSCGRATDPFLQGQSDTEG